MERERWDFLGLISFGIFIFLVGVIYTITPDFNAKLVDFFADFTTQEIAPGIFLPVVKSNHPIIYNAVCQFSLAFAAAQIGILVARYAIRDTARRKADTISGIVFWAGVAWISYLLANGQIPFGSIYSYGIILIGVSIVTTGIGIALNRRMRGAQHAT